MTNSVLLDSNVVLRYLLDDHPKFVVQSTELFNKIRNGEIKAHISRYVLIEMIFVLDKVYSIPKAEIIKSIIDLLNIKYVVVENKELIYKALDIFDLHNISIVDALLACEAQYLSIELITYDVKLSKLVSKDYDKAPKIV